MTTAAHNSITATEAADILGLDERVVSWALDREILEGRRDEVSGWLLPRAEIEAGQAPLRDQFKAIEMSAVKPAHVAMDEPSPNQRELLAQSRGSADTPIDEILRLREEVRALSLAIREKDSIIADLARSIARISEAAINRLSPLAKP